MKKISKKTGFTLIELLVVVAIIGLLTTLAMVSLNNARKKAVDAKRIADIKSVQTGLELYFNDHKRYPPAGGSGTDSLYYSQGCLGTAGFVGTGGGIAYGACAGDIKSYIKILPNDQNIANHPYVYQVDVNGYNYGLYFAIDTNIEQFSAGTWWATAKGFKPATSGMAPAEWQ